MPVYFFAATEGAQQQITKLYDFVWPTAAAMWNLRWQVLGFVQVVPNASTEQLQSRFTEGAGIHGANLRRACIEHTWDQQKESFARFVLTNTIAVYEGWIEDVLKSLGKNTKTLQKSLQFPDPIAGPGFGITSAIAALTANESLPLKNGFHPSLRKSRHYALPKLNALMRCYRFFKELRNCDMHSGGIADQRLIDAYNDFLAIATPADLGVAEVPAYVAPTLGNPTRLSLRGVVGFSHVVLKIVTTLDAELSRAKEAEKLLAQKWRRTYPHPRTLSANAKKRQKQIQRKLHNAGFPKASDPNKFGDFLSDLGLLQF
jgi:hypothetical protein